MTIVIRLVMLGFVSIITVSLLIVAANVAVMPYALCAACDTSADNDAVPMLMPMPMTAPMLNATRTTSSIAKADTGHNNWTMIDHVQDC